MPIRVKIAEFGITQKSLALAIVTIFEADDNGEISGTKASLYKALTGTEETSNPQILDSEGKLNEDCYIETDVVASISGISDRTERSIKKIKENPLSFSLPVTSSNFFYVNTLIFETNASISAAAALISETNAAAAEAQTILDAAATAADRVQTGLDAISAEASKLAAAASAAEGLYNNIDPKVFADSPIVPLASEEGTLFLCDTSGGNIVINLSALSVYAEDMKFAFVKTTADANTITVNRGGTDAIDAGTSRVISEQFIVTAFIGHPVSGLWISVVQAAAVANDSITNAKLTDMAQATIKGRASGAGTGDPVDLTAAQVKTIIGGLGAGVFSGLIPSPAADTANDITFSAGSAPDSTGSNSLVLASAQTKQLDVSWATGNNAGGLASAVTLSGPETIHCFITDDGSGGAELGYDTSITAVNLLTDTGGTTYRRIFSFRTTAGDAIESLWDAYELSGGGLDIAFRNPALDIDDSSPGTSAVTRVLSSLPTGFSIKSSLNVFVTGSGNICGTYISPLTADDEAVSGTAAPLASVQTQDGSNGSEMTSNIHIWTDASAQIRSRNESAGALRISPIGYMDSRA